MKFYVCLHVKPRKLLQISKQVVTRLLPSRYQDVFVLIPSCCPHKLLCITLLQGGRRERTCYTLFQQDYNTAVHFIRILQWWGKTAKGPIFLVLHPGKYAITEGVSRVPQARVIGTQEIFKIWVFEIAFPAF